MRVWIWGKIRELEEEIRRLWVEIPRERKKSGHDIEHVDKEYILDPGGEVRGAGLQIREILLRVGREGGGVEDCPTARHQGEATEQADPAILNPHFFFHFRGTPQEIRGRLVSGW